MPGGGGRRLSAMRLGQFRDSIVSQANPAESEDHWLQPSTGSLPAGIQEDSRDTGFGRYDEHPQEMSKAGCSRIGSVVSHARIAW